MLHIKSSHNYKTKCHRLRIWIIANLHHERFEIIQLKVEQVLHVADEIDMVPGNEMRLGFF